MSTSDPGTPENTEISTTWIVIFLLLALGLGASAILFAGGEIVGAGQVVAPGVF